MQVQKVPIRNGNSHFLHMNAGAARVASVAEDLGLATTGEVEDGAGELGLVR